MWCESCADDIVADAESVLLYDTEVGWVHVLMLPNGDCDAHTALGARARFRSGDTCARLRAGEHLVRGEPLAGPGSFVTLEPGPGEKRNARLA